MIRQYDIWLADLNPRIGTEPGKVRPVVVIQSNLLNKVHPSTLICPVSTNVVPKAEILRVHLEPGSTGLQQQSDILVDQVRAVDKKRLLKRLGTLDHGEAVLLRKNLRIVLDLE